MATEMHEFRWPGGGSAGLQWGRRLMATEMTVNQANQAIKDQLQWGRRVMATEMGPYSSPSDSQTIRFNGAVV